MTSWHVVHHEPNCITILSPDGNGEICSVTYHENGLMTWMDRNGDSYQPNGNIPDFVRNAIFLMFRRMFMKSPKDRKGQPDLIEVVDPKSMGS